MPTLPTDPNLLLGTIRSLIERLLDQDAESIDTGDAVELAHAVRALDVTLMNEEPLPLPWRIRTAGEVKHFLKEHRDDHVDPKTDELDCTGLAEAAAAALDLHIPTPNVEVPEVLFELAATFNEDDG